jgi:hypothetical protein
LKTDAGDIPAGPGKTHNETARNRIVSYRNDGHGSRGILRRVGCRRAPGDDHGHAAADQFARQRGQTVVLTLSPAPFDVYVVTLDEAGILQSLDKSGQ